MDMDISPFRPHRPIQPGSIRDPKSDIPLKSVVKYVAFYLARFILMLVILYVVEIVGIGV